MIPEMFRLCQPPARPLVKTGADADALFRTAAQLAGKGRPALVRITAPIKGEAFTLYIHQARNKHTGETWTLATYESRNLPGHVRQIVVTPQGETWTLFPATKTDPAKAIFNATKYFSHLWQIQQEGRNAQ